MVNVLLSPTRGLLVLEARLRSVERIARSVDEMNDEFVGMRADIRALDARVEYRNGEVAELARIDAHDGARAGAGAARGRRHDGDRRLEDLAVDLDTLGSFASRFRLRRNNRRESAPEEAVSADRAGTD